MASLSGRKVYHLGAMILLLHVGPAVGEPRQQLDQVGRARGAAHDDHALRRPPPRRGAQHVGAARGLHVRRAAHFARSGIAIGGRVRCSAMIGTSVARRAASDRHLVVLPRVQVDARVRPGRAASRPARRCRSACGCPRPSRGPSGPATQMHLADLQRAVLRELARTAASARTSGS